MQGVSTHMPKTTASQVTLLRCRSVFKEAAKLSGGTHLNDLACVAELCEPLLLSNCYSSVSKAYDKACRAESSIRFETKVNSELVLRSGCLFQAVSSSAEASLQRR